MSRLRDSGAAVVCSAALSAVCCPLCGSNKSSAARGGAESTLRLFQVPLEVSQLTPALIDWAHGPPAGTRRRGTQPRLLHLLLLLCQPTRRGTSSGSSHRHASHLIASSHVQGHNPSVTSLAAPLAHKELAVSSRLIVQLFPPLSSSLASVLLLGFMSSHLWSSSYHLAALWLGMSTISCHAVHVVHGRSNRINHEPTAALR